MSNRSVLNQTLNTMKNQFFLFQIDGLDHRINHGEHPFLIPVSHHIYIVAPRRDNLFNDPIGTALFIEDLKSFNLEAVILAFRQRLEMLTFSKYFSTGQKFCRVNVIKAF